MQYAGKTLTEISLAFGTAAELGPSPDASIPHGFSVKSPEGETYRFYVAKREELNVWLACLHALCYFTDFHERYDFARQIDKGKASRICLYKHRTTEEIVVAKIFDKETFLTKGYRLRALKNEISSMRRLQSKHTVCIKEFYQTETELIIVMDYMEGGTLFARLMQKRRFPEREAALIIKSLVEGLEFIHGQGYLHRDIKLENVFMAQKNSDVSIKVGDFDLAAPLDQCDPTKLYGTPGYMAPEIFTKSSMAYSSKSDIFSAGVVLYTIVFGSFPMKGKISKELMEANRNFTLNTGTSRWQQISPECNHHIAIVKV
jgi:serine/threonine protein kinase